MLFIDFYPHRLATPTALSPYCHQSGRLSTSKDTYHPLNYSLERTQKEEASPHFLFLFCSFLRTHPVLLLFSLVSDETEERNGCPLAF
jgi:hypothetical protein